MEKIPFDTDVLIEHLRDAFPGFIYKEGVSREADLSVVQIPDLCGSTLLFCRGGGGNPAISQ